MEDNNMKRGLNSRHISMIAIGGAIGTGLLWQLEVSFLKLAQRSYISLYTNWYYALFFNVINRRISNFLSGFWFF